MSFEHYRKWDAFVCTDSEAEGESEASQDDLAQIIVDTAGGPAAWCEGLSLSDRYLRLINAFWAVSNPPMAISGRFLKFYRFMRAAQKLGRLPHPRLFDYSKFLALAGRSLVEGPPPNFQPDAESLELGQAILPNIGSDSDYPTNFDDMLGGQPAWMEVLECLPEDCAECGRYQIWLSGWPTKRKSC